MEPNAVEDQKSKQPEPCSESGKDKAVPEGVDTIPPARSVDNSGGG